MAPDIPRQIPEQPQVRTISDLDQPDHGRLRRLVAAAFSSRNIEALRPFVRNRADTLIDAMLSKGSPSDLVESLALPLPISVIGRILGVPDDDLDKFKRLAGAAAGIQHLPAEEYHEMVAGLDAYLADLVAQQRQEPSNDVLGKLVAARDNQDQLTESELISLGVTILAAGYLTTAGHIANDTFVILSRPDLWEMLCSDRASVAEVADELLRFVHLGDGTGFPRVALEDVEFDGVTVRAGETVFVSISSANRDPRAFAHPGQIDVERRRNPHLAFGYGPHRCLGAYLATMEIQESLGALARKAPDLQMAVTTGEIQWDPASLIRRPLALPVQWQTK